MDTNPHERSVDCVVWWGVARGLSPTAYGPALPVTRAQMATFIARAITQSGGQLPEGATDRFGDDDASTHETNIDRLAAAGIVGGLSDGSYGPDRPVTRAQMASFLVRAVERVVGRPLPEGGGTFADDDGSAHELNIDKIARAGLTGGNGDGTYRPAVSVSRDQMASFLARLLDLLVEESGARPPG